MALVYLESWRTARRRTLHVPEIFIVEGDSAGGCFSGDTKVALADGRDVSFEDLVREQDAGKEHFCYTILADGSIGIERATNVRMTKRGFRGHESDIG